MHDVVVDGLERYLQGEASPAVTAHLASCAECREMVEEMAGISASLRELGCLALDSLADEAPQPAPGFFLKVEAQILAEQQTRVWGIFSPGPAFFRRIAFASLLLLAGLGGFLVTHESETLPVNEEAAAIMAQQNPGYEDFVEPVTTNSGSAHLLVTLASYGQ
jgi:hypothetical protein